MHNYRILTVGDGDLSLSVALARAYRELELVPSTLLPDALEIHQTYPTSAEGNLAELEQRGISVRYGIDATQLHMHFDSDLFDLVMFQHPHLGDYDQKSARSEAQHLQRHHVLLSHYLASAASILRPNGRVQVALKTNQATSWELYKAAARVGLVECRRQTAAKTSIPYDKEQNDHKVNQLLGRPSPMPVQHPLHYIFGRVGVDIMEEEKLFALPPPSSSSVKAPRQARMSRTASKHWLGKYGYRPMRTFPSGGATGKMDVAGSMHYFFELSKHPVDEEITIFGGGDCTNVQCSVCGVEFETALELEAHALAPALPIPPSGGNRVKEFSSYQNRRSSSSLLSSSSSSSTNTEVRACRKEDSVEVTPDTTTNVRCNLAVEAGLAVSPEYDGSRLRWFLHQVQLKGLSSKRDCQRLITSGRILLDGQVTLDSGRILHAGNIITLVNEKEEKTNSVPSKGQTIKIVDSWSRKCHVVWKPVGMRTIGSFDTNTLEQTFSRQQHGSSYRSLSKLDTGASGLCVLVDSGDPTFIDQEHSIIHTFSALVFGHVPSEWKDGVSIQLPVEGKRRWRRQAKDTENDGVISNKTASATLHCVEQTSNHESLPPLSTITVSTDSSVSGLVSIICSYLRKVRKHPVVGDRFVTSEYKELPRFLRNRLKNRLCVACTCVQAGEEKTEHPVPERWSARFWESQYMNMGCSWTR